MKNLLLIVVITFAILSCKKTDDNPVEPKDEWVLADSVEIFEDASIISLNLVKPLNYRYGYFYNEPETQYMILDSTTNFEYIKKYINYSDDKIKTEIFDILNFYKVSTLNYKHIISFIDWRHPYLGAKTELVCYVNHYRKELKLVNRGNITNPDIIANYFYNQYARYKYKNYPNYKLILQDEITFKNL